MPAVLITHRAEPLDPENPHGPARALCGLDNEVCAWDDTVPAEEEVLKLKLAVEKRERWLLGLA